MIETDRRRILPLIILTFAPTLAPGFIGSVWAAESSDGVWRDFDEKSVQLRGIREIVPLRYRSVELDWPALNGLLAMTPMEDSANALSVDTVLTLPLPDGGFGRFHILESPIMAPALAASFPEIRTYRGQGVDDPTASVRFDTTPAGFHAMILSAAGRVFIDPYSREETERYISYFTRDYPRPADLEFECGFDEVNPWREAAERPEGPPSISSGTQLRTYRTAVAATGEYTQFHGGTKAAGQAAIVTAMNRVNGIYEREVAIRMVLVADNIDVVYTNGGTDPYTNNNGGAMLGQNQSNLNSVIGSANYDIGHVFSTGGGGIAALGVVCKTASKAQGVTGLASPIGDVFWVDYVSHEMGHQWGAYHSFNGNAGACNGNRTASFAYEPGSGSTIMGYAGICGNQNLQSNSDDYFHGVSFDQIVAYSTTGFGNTCASTTATENNPPSVEAGASYKIPKGTPFILCGAATDPNGDPLTYGWEEFDKGPAGEPDSPSGDAPIFRSFDPVTSACRTFPKWSDIVNNTETIGEILPTYTRTLTFRLTARDNRSVGGGVDSDTTTVPVADTAGPFLVTSPNTAVSWTGGDTETVSWDVANTDAVPVSCDPAEILLSTDGGWTYPTTVLCDVSNDGSQSITVPEVSTSTARLMVKCSTGIFFDISNSNFTITPGGRCFGDPVVLTNDTVKGVELFQAADTITAGPNFVVASCGDVTFQAGSTIILKDGFSVESGGRFKAEFVSGICQP
ncbi:MAG: reprolysin-like metallopeptidase [Thermoanaerobaculia bacterium]